MKQKVVSPADVANLLEKSVCIIAAVSLILIAAAESVARLFGTGIPSSTGLLSHFLLVLGLFAGMFTAKTGDHLAINLIHYIKNEKVKHYLGLITGSTAVYICTIITWSSLSFIRNAVNIGDSVGFIPVLIFAIAMPLAYGVMTFRFAKKVFSENRFFPIAAFLISCIISFPVIISLFFGVDHQIGILWDISDTFLDIIYAVRIPAIIFLIATALIGAPLFTVIGGIALIMIQSAGGVTETVNISIFSAFTDNSLIAIPLFTITGYILSESRAGERLVRCFRSLFSWIPGGMIIATVIISAFFTSFTGASGVTILALGGILLTVLSGTSEKPGYPKNFSIGLLTSAGCIGLLFPPSLPIILAGSTTRTNIIHMFLGAIIPGIIMVVAMIAVGIIISGKTKIQTEPFKLKAAASSIKESAFEIILPIFLVAGFFTGIFSLVELSAISVIFVFVVEITYHKDIKLRDMPKVFFKALPIIGGILTIIAVAKALSYAITDTQAPMHFAAWLSGAVQSKILFLLFLNIALLLLGCFMDIFSAIIVALPLVFPLGEVYGIDPVHMGVIFIINLGVGFITPPMGINLFLASYRFDKPFLKVCRYVVPFLIVQIIVVLLVTYVPAFSTFLPGLVK